MIGRRNTQKGLFDVGYALSLHLDPKSFHGQLAAAAAHLFKDDDFRALYDDGGRPSVPPSQLALLMLLQHEARVSDEEAINRSRFDARWAMVLGTQLGEALCAKSTLQTFRGQVVLHKKARQILQSSLKEARRKGLLKGRPLALTIDTMPMIGAGAVKDTYNLVGTGIAQVIRAVAKAQGETPAAWAAREDLERYLPGERHGSLKGDLDLDWSDKQARQQALTEITTDALRAYRLADAAAAALPAAAARTVREAQVLLGELLLQDVEVKPAGADGTPATAAIKEGTARDRIPSASDPDQRHGHKSKAQRFTGHKSRTAVDVETLLIVEAEVIAGNAADAEGLLSQVERVEETTGETVARVYGDCAMGNGATRAEFAAKEKELFAKVAAESENGGRFPKSRFEINLEAETVSCPAGQCTSDWTGTRDGKRVFRFGDVCAGCALRPQCTESPQGRTVHVHPQELLLRVGRALQATAEGRRELRKRLAAEHRQARLAQLGAKRARYRGQAKCEFQLLMAGAIANLRRTWNWAQAQAAGLSGDPCVCGAPAEA